MRLLLHCCPDGDRWAQGNDVWFSYARQLLCKGKQVFKACILTRACAIWQWQFTIEKCHVEDQPTATFRKPRARVQESGHPPPGSEIKDSKVLSTPPFHAILGGNIIHVPSKSTFNGLHKVWLVWLCLRPVAQFIFIDYTFSFNLQKGGKTNWWLTHIRGLKLPKLQLAGTSPSL